MYRDEKIKLLLIAIGALAVIIGAFYITFRGNTITNDTKVKIGKSEMYSKNN